MQYPCLGIEHHRLYLYILSRAAWIVDFSVLWKRAQGSFVYCREVMAAAGGEIGKVVNVNVGGILYTTTLATLTKVRLVKFYRIDNVKYMYPSSQRLALTTIEQFSAQPPWPTSQWFASYMIENV